MAESRPDERIEHGLDDSPTFIVKYDPEKRDRLTSWVDSDDKRDLLAEHDHADLATISTSWEDAGVKTYPGGFSRVSGGLQSLSWVEYVDANVTMSFPEPLTTLEDSSAWDVDLDYGERIRLAVSRTPTPSSSGLAFDEDALTASISDAREHVRADDTLVSSVGTSGMVVAVVDTGCNTDGGDLESRLLPESQNLITGETVGDNGPEAVADGADSRHGSWVSHCIVGPDGFAPGASLLALKALGDDGSGSTADIIAAIEVAIDEGADVICLSLGSPMYSKALAVVLEQAAENDVLPVVAAGNDRIGGSTWVNSPADADDALAINATNVPESGDRDDTKIANFGNIGPDPGVSDLSNGDTNGATPALAAPGMAIRITLPNGPKELSGTSMAAPMVAGGATLIRASENLTVEEAIDRLTVTSYPLPNVGETEAENGLLDVQAAINNAEPDETQADVRNDEAQVRDEFNRWLSNTQGGWL
ncbi:S8 family serine peptidase [Saliphagus sp. GCM10025334]